MTIKKETKLKSLTVDNMLINILRDSHGLSFADVSSYFYQLTLQTFESEPNMIGPNRVPTGQTVQVKDGSIGGRKRLNIIKKVKEPQKVGVHIWVVRGFYPETGIPFKLTLWESQDQFFKHNACKVELGKFANRKAKSMINISEVDRYVNEVSERTLLDQSTEDLKKPENIYTAEYRLLTPANMGKQPNAKAKSKKASNKRSKAKRKTTVKEEERES